LAELPGVSPLLSFGLSRLKYPRADADGASRKERGPTAVAPMLFTSQLTLALLAAGCSLVKTPD